MSLATQLAQDLYLSDGVDFGDVVLAIAKAAVAFVVLLVSVMLMVWFERKVVGRLQNRLGPTVAGPAGIFQTLADGIKLFFKEDIIPNRSDRFVFQLAPYLALVPAFLTFILVPIAGDFSEGGNGSVTVFGRETFLQVADVPVGILFFLAMSSIGLYGIMLAGWSSGSKYPLLGSIRASAQAISYEAALGLSLAAVLLVSGSLSTNEIVMVQAGEGFRGFVPNWNVIVTGFVPFAVFLIAGTAELNRPPFDLVEAEQELVGGFHTEYSSIRFALFFLAEFMNTVTLSAIIVTIFFGGPAGPNFGILPGWLWGFVWFFLKLLVFLFTFVWFRATLPRLRYDQLMDLGWKLLIPLALGWLLILGGIRVAQTGGFGFTDSTVADTFIVLAIGLAIALVAAGLLMASIRTARTERLRGRGLVELPYGQEAP
ncbi:MAG: NADH-quinone oxidoreductase subunit NuoH [Actinomycetia bacterium]|nr:NADH-quinone oxidoreductase subunit NuoH [Actinomycetes bacterium]MCP4226872.1 NADH-quinone oxidoreductase subunit NuoH [Actinomycetes bacterium]MCP5032871.1 NADH-quinone oxidoreductase subunit NuoH [Actinomycetes bacterium]